MRVEPSKLRITRLNAKSRAPDTDLWGAGIPAQPDDEFATRLATCTKCSRSINSSCTGRASIISRHLHHRRGGCVQQQALIASVLSQAALDSPGDTLLELFNRWASGNWQQLALLDVSSNADRLIGRGVRRGRRRPRHRRVRLHHRRSGSDHHGANAQTFLLPQFQWEPVYNKFNKLVPADPAGLLSPQNDGGPTLAGANTVTLVPVAPVSGGGSVNAFAQEQKTASVLFTLPFGLQAVAGSIPQTPAISHVPACS